MLLVGSGSMIRTFQALRSVEPGFTDPEQLQVIRIVIPGGLARDRERVLRLQNDLIDKLSAVPGVTSASLIDQRDAHGRYSHEVGQHHGGRQAERRWRATSDATLRLHLARSVSHEQERGCWPGAS